MYIHPYNGDNEHNINPDSFTVLLIMLYYHTPPLIQGSYTSASGYYLHILDLFVSGIVYYITIFLLLLLPMIILICIDAVCIGSSFLFTVEEYIIVWMYHNCSLIFLLMGIYVLFFFLTLGLLQIKPLEKLNTRLYEYMFLISWVTPRRRMVESQKEYAQFLFKKLRKNNFLNIFQDFIHLFQRQRIHISRGVTERESQADSVPHRHPTKLFSKILDILTNND